jgi:CBS domain-containing protein
MNAIDFATTRRRSGPELQHVPVSDAMHPGVLTCPVETPLRTLARMMAAHRVHSIVVYGDPEEAEADGLIWGVVSDLDLVGAATVGDVEDRTAGGTAASPVVRVSPDETLDRAAQLMHEHGTAHLVVVDPGANQPVGVISTLDIARVLARPAPFEEVPR